MTTIKKLLATTAVAMTLAIPAAYAANTVDVKAESSMDHSKNGGYDKTTSAEKSTPSGTVSDKTETNLDVDNDGDSKKTTTMTHTDDPKGLMNKHTSKTKVVEKNKDGKTTIRKSVDGNTVSNTTTSY